MTVRCTAVNLLWSAACLPAWSAFRSALFDPARSQQDLLNGYLRRNEETAFGRLHGFASIRSVEDFQSRVAISSYDDLQPFVRRVAAGEPGVLTRDPVRRLAPSSGSAAAVKLLPHTARLQCEFSRAVDPWIVNLYRSRPDLAQGPAYWSISPAMPTPVTTASVLPVGFEDDSTYLGGARQALVRSVLSVPSDVRLIDDVETFRYTTLLFLLHARELRLMSVWHPSFLTCLVGRLEPHWERLLRDVERGELNPPGAIQPAVRTSLVRRLRAAPARAQELRSLASCDYMAIWPKLGTISCWGDGPARSSAAGLHHLFPGAMLQPKGLIATEAVVTIPFDSCHPLAIRSHFFEFIDPGGRARLAGELESGTDYTIVVTTGGGLYRYRLGDRVAVDGWVERTPSLRFVGKDDTVSDRCGEKLCDAFVAGVLDAVFAGGPRPRFAMLAPDEGEVGVRYTLWVESTGDLPARMAAMLEHELRRNPHYAWCVDLGQLRPARIVRVANGADRAFIDFCVARGQREGDVKPVSLHTWSGWERLLGVKSSGRAMEARPA